MVLLWQSKSCSESDSRHTKHYQQLWKCCNHISVLMSLTNSCFITCAYVLTCRKVSLTSAIGALVFCLGGTWPGYYWISHFVGHSNVAFFIWGTETRQAQPFTPCSFKDVDVLCELVAFKVSFVIIDAMMAPTPRAPSATPQTHTLYTLGTTPHPMSTASGPSLRLQVRTLFKT